MQPAKPYVEYTYDDANRLISVTGISGTTTYAYDGLGNRYQQTVNGATITYVLDIAAGLTQVLSDGTNEYLYGNSRIAQDDGTDMQYFLGDVLGSVRQLADASGTITLAKNYDPYGNVESSVGTGETMYGFDAEQTDETGLVFLRARYYRPYLNQFIQPDTIVPDPRIPADWNKYAYTRDNPINYTDPSGHYSTSQIPLCPPGSIRGPRGCVREPRIIGRDEWGASPVQGKVECNWRGQCHVVGEGFYDPKCWETGYALYSQLLPGESLADVYDTIVIHHLGNKNNTTVQEVQAEQMAGGLVDIAYHFIVGKDGSIYEGRDIAARGAHVELGNSRKIGILVIGDFEPGDYIERTINGKKIEIKISDEPADNLTQLQSASVENLVAYLDAIYIIDRVKGHRFFNETRCPGENLMPFVNYLDRTYGEGAPGGQ